ncbi:hypothetical protein JCM3774_004321 [Rhodotorula dairenensis]
MTAGPFLHLKFGAGRPPPHEHEHASGTEMEGPSPILFAHEVELALQQQQQRQQGGYDLADTLKSDVQRASVARWLEQNFKAGTYIHDVVHKREGEEGMFALVTKNWARSVGDPKLHLSLYIYQDHMHVATWHAYSDRSVSYSRAGDENAPPPEGSDPYSTPEALEAALVQGGTLAPAVLDGGGGNDDGRPRFDRPAAAPPDNSDSEDRDEAPFRPEEVVDPPKGRAARKPRPEEEVRDDSSSGESYPGRRVAASEKDSAAVPSQRRREAASESEDSRSPSPPPQERSSRKGAPAYPIVKSRPLGQSSRTRSAEESPASSERAPRVERGRDRTPVSPVSPSSSVPAAAASRREAAAAETDRLDRQRERSRRRARPAEPSKPDPQSSRGTSSSRSRTRTPPPMAQSRSHRKARPVPEEGQGTGTPPVASGRRDRSARRPKPPRSPSPSPTPPRSPELKHRKPTVDEKKGRQSDAREQSSRSPSPPVQPTKSRSKKSTRPSPDAEFSEVEDVHRGHSRAPAAAPQLARKPSWRSVSRNRHRRNGSDSSGDDTLVRGDLADPDLDIPAGGEATLLTAKRRASVSERSARRPRPPRRDDSFDPQAVQNPPIESEAPKQTATAVLGSWIKSVGTLLKQEVAGAPDSDPDSDDEARARLQRKAERAERRAARAARRAARQAAEAGAEATATEASASEAEGARRSSGRRRRHEHEEQDVERAEPAAPPTRPALRERAMSLSATLDSGFKNLRDSVNKIVAGPKDPSDGESALSEEDRAAARARRRHRSQSRRCREDSDKDSAPRPADDQPGDRSQSERSGTEDAHDRRRERSRRREKLPQEERLVAPVDRQEQPSTCKGHAAPSTRIGHEDSDDDPGPVRVEGSDEAQIRYESRSARSKMEDRQRRRERSRPRRREQGLDPVDSRDDPDEDEGRTSTRSVPTPSAPVRELSSDEAVGIPTRRRPAEEPTSLSKLSRQEAEDGPDRDIPLPSTSRASRQDPPTPIDRVDARPARTPSSRPPDAFASDSSNPGPPRTRRAVSDRGRGEYAPETTEYRPARTASATPAESPKMSKTRQQARNVDRDRGSRRRVEPRPAPPTERSPSPLAPACSPSLSSSNYWGTPPLTARSSVGGSLTDEEDEGEESRFDARPALSCRSFVRDSGAEHVPPLPAPTAAASSPMYGAAPVRPLPLRAKPGDARYGNRPALDHRRLGPSDSSREPGPDLPHAGSLSRSQAAFEPTSEESFDSQAETSAPDSVAFRGRLSRGSPGSRAHDKGQSAGNGRLGHGRSTAWTRGRQDSDEESLTPPRRSHMLVPPRPDPMSVSPSMNTHGTAYPPSESSRTMVSTAASPVHKSRTMVGPRPFAAPGPVSGPAKTARYDSYVQDDRSRPLRSSYFDSEPPSLSAAQRAQRASLAGGGGGAARSAGPSSSSSSSMNATGRGDSAAPGLASDLASRSFDRWTAKGRESGSVQLFGRHGAPVSRRTARRLGMQ